MLNKINWRKEPYKSALLLTEDRINALELINLMKML